MELKLEDYAAALTQKAVDKCHAESRRLLLVTLVNYVHQGGIGYISVWLLVSMIMQKLHNQFSQNSVKRWHMGGELTH